MRVTRPFHNFAGGPGAVGHRRWIALALGVAALGAGCSPIDNSGLGTAIAENEELLRSQAAALAEQQTRIQAVEGELSAVRVELRQLREQAANGARALDYDIAVRVLDARSDPRVTREGRRARGKESGPVLGTIGTGHAWAFGCRSGAYVDAVGFDLASGRYTSECRSLWRLDPPGREGASAPSGWAGGPILEAETDQRFGLEDGGVGAPELQRCPEGALAVGLEFAMTERVAVGYRLTCAAVLRSAASESDIPTWDLEAPVSLAWVGEETENLLAFGCAAGEALETVAFFADATGVTGGQVGCDDVAGRQATVERAGRPSTGASGGDEPEGEVGFLTVDSIPSGQVYIDGKLVSSKTPLTKHPVEEGSHTVRVYYIDEGKFSETKRAVIAEGRQVNLYFQSK